MKKTLSAVMVLVFLFGVSMAYACGEKKSSAEATATKVDASSAKSSCCPGGAEAKAAVGGSDEVKVATMQATNAVSNCAQKAGASGVNKASAAGGCHTAEAAAVQKASVKITKTDAEYCAPSPDCPNPCVKEGGAKGVKMEKTSKVKSDGMASTKKIAAPEAETLK